MESIPILDSTSIVGKLDEIEKVEFNIFADKLGTALSGIGFTYLVNHGLDLSKIERVYEISKEFFDKSVEIKKEMRKPPGAASFHGYAGPGDELLNESQPDATELREFFDVTGHIESNDLDHFPSPEFKIAFDEARIECADLADKLLRAIAIYLGLKEDDLVKRHTHLKDRNIPTQTVMRSSMYSPLMYENSALILPGAIRCGEHCDWHTITLLFQDLIGGLEVRGTSGQWVQAIPIKDAILLNSGQLLEIYSGGLLPATPHRVRILDEEKLLTKPRQSLVYCPSPDGHEEVEPLIPICKELNGKVRSIYGPQSYDKVNAYEWVHSRHAAAASY